jgi:hypothetical protein
MEDENSDLEEVENPEFEVQNLGFDWTESAQIDENTILWLIESDLPSDVEGVDHSRAVSHGSEPGAYS